MLTRLRERLFTLAAELTQRKESSKTKQLPWHVDSRPREKRDVLFSMTESEMKPKRIQRHRGANWRGKAVGTGDTTALSQAKPPSHVSSSARNKPFAGKVFYLDLPSNRTAETLEMDIKQLGGIVEKFFSKEIKYLVSNKREARYVQCLRQDSPVPSPDSGPSSPHPRSNPHRPGSHGDNMKSRSQGQTDTLVTSRGKSLVERVVKEQERIQMNKILSNALDWGVKILYIDDVMAYVKKRKKIVGSQCPATSAAKTNVKPGSASKQGFQKCRGGRIGKPFVKVEDSSRHYRPIYLTMSNMPEFNLKTVPPCSPFSVEDKNSPGNKQDGQRGAKASASEDRAHGRKKNRDKKRGGYCECCMIKYENLTMHLQSERHKAFSKSDEYLVVDRQVSTLPCNFIHVKTQVKRRKCSVSSVLVAPGPCGKTELRHRGDLVTAETVKEEQQQTVEVESYSGHALKIRSVPGFARLIHRERDRRNCRTYSERAKAKSLALKRLCRQNSLTSCTHKAAQTHILQPKRDTVSSTGERLEAFPSRVSQVDSVDLISHIDKNSMSSCSHNIDVQNYSSKGLNVVTNQQEQSDTNTDVLQFEAVQDGSIFPDKMTGNYSAENTEEQLPPQSLSPAWKIQRKVRAFKRRRRKVDPNIEHVKPSDSPDSVLKLWELFESSDDMDVEFHGFED
ncbi:protein DBF4 homolog A isoform X2 [Hippoglossus hippoglossus]|uniref:protein DBF4 homolog A isoform X2 n=1 Tax=Hippoglossus hippoglossus TaxID=8267 RepID=UPI00148B5FD0|nr:protein DBF4 homolog A isoform X2 [Hippoglossus hippoglossus]